MSPILFSMLLFSLAGAISPGPVNLIAASIGARAGVLKALPHVTGASVSYCAIVWLMGSGLHRLLTSYPDITGLLQWVGAAYLLYLSAKIATAQPVTDKASSLASAAGLLQGVLSQSLNPKAWLVAMSGVSLFVTAGANAPRRLLAFCIMSGVVCFCSIATWAALGKFIGKRLNKANDQHRFNQAMAFLLATTVLSMLFST